MGSLAAVKMVKTVYGNVDLQQKFLEKWGIPGTKIADKLNDFGFHGGVWSKEKSLENLGRNINGLKVLDIGPETGVEVFLLLESGAKVTVCDPDNRTLQLIEDISKKYITEDGKTVADRLKFVTAGFSLDPEKISAEKRNFEAVEKMLKTGMPTYYEVGKFGSIGDIEGKFDVVFIHKILTTLTRFTSHKHQDVFSRAVEEVLPKINPGGVLSWTEPSNLFDGDFAPVEKWGVTKTVKYQVQQVDEDYVQYLIQPNL